MKQVVIVATGHIGSGKTTLGRELREIYAPYLRTVDIANIHKKYHDYQEETMMGEKRHNYLEAETFTHIYQNHIVYVELVGMEPWLEDFLAKLHQLHIPIIEIELKRSSLKRAIDAIQRRNRLDPELGELESAHLREHYGTTFNESAKLFRITDNVNGPVDYIDSVIRGA